MMELREPKRKRRVPPVLQQSFPIPIGGISAISAGHWQVYYGRYLGDCVVVEDPNDMAALYSKGFFGKSSLSRDMPKFQKGATKTPIFIRQRQWERRCMWAKKQQAVVSNLQDMLTQENGQNIYEQVSRMPLKGQFHSSTKEPDSEDVHISEKTAVDNGTVTIDETNKHNERTEHTTTKSLGDKSEVETELVVLESEDETKVAVKSSAEKNYDVILLDSEEDEAISVVDETRSSREIKASKDQNFALASNVSQSKLTSGNKVDVASEDSEDSSIILNESEEKTEIISVDKNEVSDVIDSDRIRNDYKRGRREIDDDAVPQEKRRRISGKDEVVLENVNLNKSEIANAKSHASREDEVILIDMEECSKEVVEREVVQKQTEIEGNSNAGERNKKDTSIEVSKPADESDAIEKSESERSEKKMDISENGVIEAKVPLPNKNTEEVTVGDSSVKPACELEPSAKAKDSNTMEMGEVINFDEPKASGSDNVATEEHEENISDPEKTNRIYSCTDAIVHVEVEKPNNITKDAGEHKARAHQDSNKNRSANEDDEDLVLVLSDGDSDSEEFVKNLNPRLEKDMFAVRETLQLMPEEAFFLSFGLGCLQIVDMCGNILSLTQMWQLFKKSDANFISKYIAYHYFRSKGWVVKPGIKFGGDYLLYKQGPAFYHSSYVVIVETVDGTSWILDDKVSRSLSWTRLHGLVRLAESSGKEILLCQVIKPPDVTQESMDSPSIICKFKVHEQLIRRWVSSEEREDDDFSE